jgi:hypothetical protein
MTNILIGFTIAADLVQATQWNCPSWGEPSEPQSEHIQRPDLSRLQGSRANPEMANFLTPVLLSKLDASEDKQEISHKQGITGMSTNKTPYKKIKEGQL